MLQVPWGCQDSSDIGRAEDGGEPSRPPGIRDMFQHPLLPERGVIEKAERTDRLIKKGPGDVPILGQVMLVSPDVFRSQAIGWGVKVLRKFRDAPQVAADGIGRVVPEL
jgi:hypothetical protein